jgi:hypothetical protein
MAAVIDSRHITEAAAETCAMVTRQLTEDGHLHLQTAIAATAYLAGTCLVRNSDVDLSDRKPGSKITLGANDRAPEIVSDIFEMAHSDGVDPNCGMLDPIPVRHQPVKSYLELMVMLDDAHQRILKRWRIPPEEQPRVAARATAQLIARNRADLEPSIGKALAAAAVMIAATSVPPPPGASKILQKKRWWQFWR